MSDDHLTTRARARLGRTLRGKWRLDALMGVGGMAAVYAATHRNGKRAAVKVLHDEVALNPDLKTRFLREGYVANAVEHPGAVSVLDDDTDEDGSVYLVMELLEGETLESRWERKGRKLDPGEVLSIVDKLLDVLVAAHKKRIVHRDIKPENVFLTRDGVVKVLDFGIARLAEMSGQPSGTLATRAGATMGTPAFMSPEQASGAWENVDGQSDLWTVGAVMFTCISGRFVHEGRNLNEQLVASATRRAPALSSVADAVDPSIAAFVDRSLAFERERRWSDAATMQRALREAYWAKDKMPSPRASRASKSQVALPPVDRAFSTHLRAASAVQMDDADDATLMMDDSPTAAGVDMFDATMPVPVGNEELRAMRAESSKTPRGSGPHPRSSGGTAGPSAPSSSNPQLASPSRQRHGSSFPRLDEPDDAPAVFKLERSSSRKARSGTRIALTELHALGSAGKKPASIDGLAASRSATLGARGGRRTRLILGGATVALALVATLVALVAGRAKEATSAAASAPAVHRERDASSDGGALLDLASPRVAP